MKYVNKISIVGFILVLASDWVLKSGERSSLLSMGIF